MKVTKTQMLTLIKMLDNPIILKNKVSCLRFIAALRNRKLLIEVNTNTYTLSKLGIETAIKLKNYEYKRLHDYYYLLED